MDEFYLIALHEPAGMAVAKSRGVDGPMRDSISGADSGARESVARRTEEVSQVARRQGAVPWVLIVDDEPLAARATARLITGATGFGAVLVTDVERALRLVTRALDAPLAVILDYELRDGENGLTVLLSLRARGYEVPCAFLTGAPDKAHAALAKSRFVDGCPVFDKGHAGAQGIVRWLAAQQPVMDSSHRSGVRSKFV